MAVPQKQQDGRYFVNVGYSTPGSRVQPKFMLGREQGQAVLRAALVEKLWAFSVELAQEFDEPQIWDTLGLHIAKRVAAGDRVIEVDIDGDAPELATSILAGWQDCVPGIKLTMKDQRAEKEGREIRRTQAQRLREAAAMLVEGGGSQRLHEAVAAYTEAIKNHKPYQTGDGGTLSLWADAKMRQIEFCRQHMPDVRLADLDMERIDECLSIIAARPFKRTPAGKPTTTPVSRSFASSTIKEFRRFLRWLHRSRNWEWEKPKDYEVVPIRVKPDATKAGPIRVKTYEPHELAKLWLYATPWERALMALALNTGSGMAEIAGLRRDEVQLLEAHPYAAQLGIDSTADDSWIKRVRGKTGVYSEWRLWPITVSAIRWLLKHRPQSTHPFVAVTKKGTPFAVASRRNNQLAHAWKRLTARIQKDESEFCLLSFNKLRKTATNAIRMKHGKEIADLFSSHGEPVGEDVIAAYTNPRFGELHRAITEYGANLQPIFGSVADPFPDQEKKGGANISPGKIRRITELHEAGEKVSAIAKKVNVSNETVRRWIKRHQPQAARASQTKTG